MTDPKKIGIDSLLPGGKGTITVTSEESDAERAHRLEQSAQDQAQERKHDGLDKDQARRHYEFDYWTVRVVLVLVVAFAAWLLTRPDASEPAIRFAWGLIGSVIGAILGLLKSSAPKK